MADEKTVWKFEIQQGNTLSVLKKLDSMLLSVKQRFDQVAQDGAKVANSFNATSSSMLNLASKATSTSKSISTLDNMQSKAAESAKRMEEQTQHLSSVMQEQNAKSSSLSQHMDGARESMSRAGNAASLAAKVGIAALVAGFVALAAAVAASVPKAMQFDATLRKINALAGLSGKAVADAGEAILRMAGKIGKGPQDLAEGLYYVASAGFSAKMSMVILEASAKAAAVGMTSTQIVANALTAVLKAFPGLSVAKAIDEMTKTVSTGKVEWENYAGVVGEVTLAASQANVAFEESQAAFAVLTNVMPSSEQTATSLKALLLTSSQFGQLADRAHSLGLTFDENAYKSMKFIDRLRYLQTITKGNSEAIYDLLGQEEAMPALTGLLTNGANDYANALDGITHSAGAADEAFKKTSAGAQAAWQRATASLESLQIKVTTALLPAINAFSDKIAPMVNDIIDWIDHTHVLENAVNGVSGSFNYIVSIGSNVALFFVNNKIAAHDLHVVMVDMNAVVDYIKLTFQQLGDVLENTYNTVYKWVASGQALRDILAELKPTLDYWGPKFDAIGDSIEQSSVAVFHWVDSGQAIKDTMTNMQPAVEYLAPKFQQLGDAFAHLRDVAMPVIERLSATIEQFSQKVAQSGVPMQILNGIFTGIVFAIGLFVDGLTLIVNGLSNVITWFTTGGSNAKWLWDMFASIGAFLASTFAPLWEKLVTVFQTQIMPAFSQLGNAVGGLIASFQPLIPVFQLIGAIIGVILVVALGILVGIISGVISGIVGLVTGLAQALGGIIQVISGILQVVIGIVSGFIDLVTGHFDRIPADLAIISSGVVSIFTGLWQVVSGIFMAAFGFFYGLISGFITGVVGYFTWLYNMLVGHSIIPDMINGIISWFQQLPGRAISFVVNLANDMRSKFLQLVNDAPKWASDMINGFINKIRDLVGNVGKVAGEVAQKVRDFLHFSVPDKGPLADADEWMPDFGDMLTRGLNAQVGKIQGASFNVASSLATPTTPDFAATPTTRQSSDTQYLAQMVTLLAQIVTLQRQSNGNVTTNMRISPIDEQRINQVIQSLGGYSMESVSRGAY